MGIYHVITSLFTSTKNVKFLGGKIIGIEKKEKEYTHYDRKIERPPSEIKTGNFYIYKQENISS
jgi:hypothetical protein